MDRKSLAVLAISFLLILGWFELVKHLYPPPPPKPKATNSLASATNLLGTNLTATGTNHVPGPPLTLSAPTPGAVFVPPPTAEQVEVLETAEVRYTFTSHGGGVKLAELKHYRESVGKGADTNKFVSLNTRAPVPIGALLGGDALQDETPFQLTKSNAVVRAEKALASGLYLVKEFRPGTNYLLTVTTRLENRSGRPVSVPAQEWVMGTATPLNAQDAGLLLAFDWYNGTKHEQITDSWFANSTLGCFPGTPRSTYAVDGAAWAGVQNQFFAVIAVPKEKAPQAVARRIELPPAPQSGPATDAKAVAKPFGFQSALVYPPVKLGTEADNNSVEHEFTLFTGPKEYKNLARLGQQLNNSNLDLVMGYGGFFGYFAKGLLLSMNGLHALGFPYALCIIAITVIIKLLFWPLTAASTKSMKRMQELQPQIKALQERFKDDSAKMNQKMMELWREHKVNPMSGCLPMVIQIPVFIGFYTMLRGAIELRGEQFLWAFDLSQADTVAHVFGMPVNPLPLIMGVTMLWQSSLTPPSPGMDPMQQKMMKYMPVIFIFALYSMSAGLTLYWTVQNLLTILQMKLTMAKKAPAPAAKSAALVAPKKKAKD